MVEAHREEIAKLEALYAAHPEGRVFTHLAEAYRRAGELDRARNILEEGLRRHPDYSSAHVVFGRVLMDLGETAGAASAFRRVLDLDRHNLVALRSLGDLSEKTGDRPAAIGYYRDLIALDPTDDWLRLTVARLEEELRAPAPQVVETGPTELEAAFREVEDHEMPSADVTAGIEMLPPAEVMPLADLETFETPPSDEATPDDVAAFTLGWPEPVDLEGEIPAAPVPEDEILESELPELPMLASGELDLAENGRATELPDAFAGLGWVDEPAEESILEGIEFPTEPFPDEVQPTAKGPPFADDETWMSVGERAEAAFSAPAESVEETPAEEERVEEITTWGPPLEQTWTAEQPMPFEPVADEESEPFKAGEPPAEVVTETMAELYARQGFYDRAIEVYRQLIDQVPEDVRLRERLREIEALEAAAAAARGQEPPAEALAWSAPYEVEETEAWVESVESMWTGGGGVAGAEETPYAWAGSSAADEGAAASGTTAGEYFRSLLGWRPKQAATPESEEMLELTDEQAVAPPAVGPDEDEIVLDAGAVEAAFEEWFGGEAPAPGSTEEAGREERGEASEADADLEMFRSWLQSLKK